MLSRRGCIILAGGLSRRMGSNKAHVKVCGKEMLRHVVDNVSGSVEEIIVAVGQRDPSNYKRLLGESVKVVRDLKLKKNPLVGVFTGLKLSSCDSVLAVPCDVPFLTPEVVDLLFRFSEGHDAAVPRWPNGELEPLLSVYKVSSSCPLAENLLRLGVAAPLELAKSLADVVFVDVEEFRKVDQELLSFFNVNTRSALAVAEKKMCRS